MERMKLEEALSCIKKCHTPDLQDYSTLKVISDEEFYYPPHLLYW